MKNMIVFSFLLFSVTLATAQVSYQVSVIDADEVPASVITAQERFFSGISVNRWEKHAYSGRERTKDRFVAIFRSNGQSTRARYSTGGKGITATTYYNGTNLPQAIQDAAASNYNGYRLMSGEQIQVLEKSYTVFRVRLRKGAQKLVVYLDEQGSEIEKPEVPEEVIEDEAIDS